MIERPEIERRAFYRIARIERRQMVRVRQFPHPRYAILPRRFNPQHGAWVAGSGFGASASSCFAAFSTFMEIVNNPRRDERQTIFR